MEKKKEYKKVQLEIATKRINKIIKDLKELKLQSKEFLDDDKIMELKSQLKYYKGHYKTYQKAFFNLRGQVNKRIDTDKYYVSDNGMIKKYCS